MSQCLSVPYGPKLVELQSPWERAQDSGMRNSYELQKAQLPLVTSHEGVRPGPSAGAGGGQGRIPRGSFPNYTWPLLPAQWKSHSGAGDEKWIVTV